MGELHGQPPVGPGPEVAAQLDDPFRRRLVGGLAAVGAVGTIAVTTRNGGVGLVEGVVSHLDPVVDAGVDSVHDAIWGEEREAEEAVDILRRELGEGFDSRIEDAFAGQEHGEGEGHHGPDALDWIGTGLFARGIGEVTNERVINKRHYFGLAGLLELRRYQLRHDHDEAGLRHLNEEIASTIKFTTAIESTVVIAEGVKMDVESAYKKFNEIDAEEPMDLDDRIAVTLELSALLSPVLTTVGGAGVEREDAKKIVEETSILRDEMIHDLADKMAQEEISPKDFEQKSEHYNRSHSRIKAFLQGQISDSDGYPLFGDPPFLATLEKFGPRGLIWQTVNVGLPLASRSLFQASRNIQEEVLRLRGVDESQIGDLAKSNSRAALRRNGKLVSNIMGRSLKNAVNVLGWDDQDEMGLQHNIIGSFADKMSGVKALFSEEHIPDHDASGSRVENFEPYQGKINEIIHQLPDAPKGHQTIHEREDAIKQFIDQENYDGLVEWLEERGLPSDAAKLHALAAASVSEEIAKGEGFDGTALDKWNPAAIFRRITDIDRMQKALGHSFTDVLDIFPFQSLSMVFVSPVFRSGMGVIDRTTAKIPNKTLATIANDAGKYLAIGGFSSYADNLVGVREGYDNTDNPAIALISGISMGRNFPWSNMANVALFPLSEYSPNEAKRNLPTQFRPHAEGFVMAEILGVADKVAKKYHVPLIGFPERVDGQNDATEAEHAARKPVSRRQFLRMGRGLLASAVS